MLLMKDFPFLFTLCNWKIKNLYWANLRLIHMKENRKTKWFLCTYYRHLYSKKNCFFLKIAVQKTCVKCISLVQTILKNEYEWYVMNSFYWFFTKKVIFIRKWILNILIDLVCDKIIIFSLFVSIYIVFIKIKLYIDNNYDIWRQTLPFASSFMYILCHLWKMALELII